MIVEQGRKTTPPGRRATRACAPSKVFHGRECDTGNTRKCASEPRLEDFWAGGEPGQTFI